LQKPLLPSCFLTWTEPPDPSGAEQLRFVSWRRSLTMKGRSFREFERIVFPLLDGTRSVDEICDSAAAAFPRDELEAAIEMLAGQGLLIDGAVASGEPPARLATQLGYFDETAPDGRGAQARLTAAKVAIFGMGGAGASVARLLATAGVGQILCIDPAVADATSPYFSGLFAEGDNGRNRAELVAERLAATAPDPMIAWASDRPEDSAVIAELVAGSDLVISCLESGELNLALKLNQACRGAGVAWLTGSLEGSEVVAGPGFDGSPDGPCYMCYRMREVATAADPQTRFALERRLDRLRRDLGARRENLAWGADILAGMLVAEAVNILTGIAEPALNGRLIVTSLLTLRQEKHVVLKKPGCPVCDRGATA